MKHCARLLGLTITACAALVVLSPTGFADHAGPPAGFSRLIGTVTFCNPYGHCHRARGAQVRATLHTGRNAGEHISGTTNTHGTFRFHLRPGHWTILVKLSLRGAGAPLTEKRPVDARPHHTALLHFDFGQIPQ